MPGVRISFLLVTLACMWEGQVAQSEVEGREYAVYAAAIEQMYLKGKQLRLMIGDRTVSFRCDEPVGMQVGECSGMRTKDQTIDEALNEVQRSLGGIKRSTLEDFLLQNQQGSELAERLEVKSTYVLYGKSHPDELPKEWSSPDFAFYFSRVGFNPEKNQALLYVAGVSWADASLSGGDYVLLRYVDNSWKVQKKYRFWKMGP